MQIRDRVKELRRVPARQLKAHPGNWRTHSDRQKEALRGMLDEVGFAGAVLARELDDGSIELIDGHCRTEMADDAEVPVLILDVTAEEAAKILLTYDPIGAMAGQDAGRLNALLATVQTASEGVAALLGTLQAQLPSQKKVAVQDEVPEVPESPITAVGDLWALGNHRLLCGDSTSEQSVAELLAGQNVDMVLTDPPYGVSYVGKTKDALRVTNDELDEDALAKLVGAAFRLAESHSRPGAYWYATVPAGPLHLLFAADWKRRGILRQILVWAKDSLVLSHAEYHYQHEPILFGSVPEGARHKNADRTRTTLWSHPRPKASREHPTMKPISLWAQAIEDGSREGELVYDCFGGSGTTLVACEQLGRRSASMEISPQYCDVIVRRWQALTSSKATNLTRAGVVIA